MWVLFNIHSSDECLCLWKPDDVLFSVSLVPYSSVDRVYFGFLRCQCVCVCDSACPPTAGKCTEPSEDRRLLKVVGRTTWRLH